MRRFSSAFLALFLIACSSSHASIPVADAGPPDAAELPDSPLVETLDGILAPEFEAGRYSGVTLVAEDGHATGGRAYGMADEGTKRPNDAQTIFHIGSLTKQFTATAILRLEQDGKLTTKTPVADFFPELSRANLAKENVDATLDDLLTHTSGIPPLEAAQGFRDGAFRRAFTPDELIALIKDTPLVAKPGTVFAYSNTGYLLLARIVEKVSGRSFENYLQETFFRPLAMTDTTTILSKDQRDRAAIGYATISGKHQALSQMSAFGDPDLTVAFGAGNLKSTAPDLVTWSRALDGTRVLNEAQKKKLWTPRLSSYACGWVVDAKGQRHNGAISPLGFYALLVRTPSSGRVTVILSNYDSDLQPPRLEGKLLAAAEGP